jgi:hypothetical protein
MAYLAIVRTAGIRPNNALRPDWQAGKAADPQARHWPGQTHGGLSRLRANPSSEASGDEPNRLSVRITLKV